MARHHGVMTKTDRQIRVEEKLGTDIVTFVDARRAAGRSWVMTAFDVIQATGIEITHETLRRWYIDSAAAQEGATR